ncbi:Protein of unknown function [Pyronema omphalodes CBS 100304]|uniref:Uncharacterized protein n=1 Tax=Pyronema omphalodes (strain CBS 100304) TaxID=1076935 RepID=U4KY86_PYROM|nr:Protein of unknown function [Pyronema omphalodes CBS 100304]
MPNSKTSKTTSSSSSTKASGSKMNSSTYHHETEPIMTDVRTGEEIRPMSKGGKEGICGSSCNCPPGGCNCASGKKSGGNGGNGGPKPGMGSKAVDT